MNGDIHASNTTYSSPTIPGSRVNWATNASGPATYDSDNTTYAQIDSNTPDGGGSCSDPGIPTIIGTLSSTVKTRFGNGISIPLAGPANVTNTGGRLTYFNPTASTSPGGLCLNIFYHQTTAVAGTYVWAGKMQVTTRVVVQGFDLSTPNGYTIDEVYLVPWQSCCGGFLYWEVYDLETLGNALPTATLTIKGCSYTFFSQGICSPGGDTGTLVSVTTTWQDCFAIGALQTNSTDNNGIVTFRYDAPSGYGTCYNLVLQRTGYVTQNYHATVFGDYIATYYIPVAPNNLAGSLLPCAISPNPGNFTVPAAANFSIVSSTTQTLFMSIFQFIQGTPAIITPISQLISSSNTLNYSITFPSRGYTNNVSGDNNKGTFALILSNSTESIQCVAPFIIQSGAPFPTQANLNDSITLGLIQAQILGAAQSTSQAQTSLQTTQSAQSAIAQFAQFMWGTYFFFPNMVVLLIMGYVILGTRRPQK